MTDKTIADAEKRVRKAPAEIKKQADHFARTMVDYLRDVGMTGVKPPSPPRPMMQEVVASVVYAAALSEAFRVKVSWPKL